MVSLGILYSIWMCMGEKVSFVKCVVKLLKVKLLGSEIFFFVFIVNVNIFIIGV